MPITDQLLRIPLSKIEVRRNERQRREIQTAELEDSIRQRGLITPIIVEPVGDKFNLVAGERRYTAVRNLGLQDIAARLITDLTPSERTIVELEENIKRKDLVWTDFVQAVLKLHRLYSSTEAFWTQEKTGQAIGLAQTSVSKILSVAEEVERGNERVLAAGEWGSAYNLIQRRDSRRIDDVFNELLGGSDVLVSPSTKAPSVGSPSSSDPAGRPSDGDSTDGSVLQQSDIFTGDFLKFANSFTGVPFTFVHCDFPYGIGLDKSDQGNSAIWGGYKDSESTYWDCCAALADNLDRLVAQSAHLMFWISSDLLIIHDTLQFFVKRAPSLTFNPKPLIWYKSDNKGILPDPKRGPRHVYETALFASRGDRFIVGAVADAYAAPTGEKIHQSEKPEPMLRHFFRMFVDEGTRMFDPTCGSGTSLRAAESLGANVFGIERNPEWAEDARTALRKYRLLRKV